MENSTVADYRRTIDVLNHPICEDLAELNEIVMKNANTVAIKENDSYFGMQYDDFIPIMEDCGYKHCYTVEFTNEYSHFIYYCKPKFLLCILNVSGIVISCNCFHSLAPRGIDVGYGFKYVHKQLEQLDIPKFNLDFSNLKGIREDFENFPTWALDSLYS